MNNYQVVMAENSTVRRWGREALSGRWGKSVLGTLVYMILMTGPILTFSFIFDDKTLSGVSDLYTFLVGGPLSLGYITFIIAIFRKNDPSPMEILYGFEKFLKALGLMFMVNLLVALWTLLFIIPGIIASCRYGMAFFILADNPEIGIMEAIRESKQMMMGNKMKFFLLQLSFIGWAILCLFTLGIGFLFLLPYMMASFTGFYEVARGSLRPGYNPLPETTKEGMEL